MSVRVVSCFVDSELAMLKCDSTRSRLMAIKRRKEEFLNVILEIFASSIQNLPILSLLLCALEEEEPFRTCSGKVCLFYSKTIHSKTHFFELSRDLCLFNSKINHV